MIQRTELILELLQADKTSGKNFYYTEREPFKVAEVELKEVEVNNQKQSSACVRWDITDRIIQGKI